MIGSVLRPNVTAVISTDKWEHRENSDDMNRLAKLDEERRQREEAQRCRMAEEFDKDI